MVVDVVTGFVLCCWNDGMMGVILLITIHDSSWPAEPRSRDDSEVMRLDRSVNDDILLQLECKYY